MTRGHAALAINTTVTDSSNHESVMTVQATRRSSLPLRNACGHFGRLLAVFVLAVMATHAGAEPRGGRFTPACAARDLAAIAALEQFAAIDEMPAAWLADAGQLWLQARAHCLGGEEPRGIALYDRIIAGEGALSAAWMTAWRTSMRSTP
jgi:hypothetical protein